MSAEIFLTRRQAGEYAGKSYSTLQRADDQGLRSILDTTTNPAQMIYATSDLDAHFALPTDPAAVERRANFARKCERERLARRARGRERAARRGLEEHAALEVADREEQRRRAEETSREQQLRAAIERTNQDREASYHATWMGVHETLTALHIGYRELAALVDSGDILMAGDEVVPRRQVLGGNAESRC